MLIADGGAFRKRCTPIDQRYGSSPLHDPLLLPPLLRPTHGCTDTQQIYVALFPCNECAKLIIQSGIQEVVYLSDKVGDRRVRGSGGSGDGDERWLITATRDRHSRSDAERRHTGMPLASCWSNGSG